MQPGTIIADRLRLIRPLGQGGMGSVWAAHHLTLNAEVAVKLMSPDLVSSEHALARFQREAQAAAQLTSPHVVRVFDSGVSADGVPFITMELLHGEDLGTRVRRQGVLPLELVREVVVQSARGLGSAHRLGTVHRDIKPENIFISDEDGAPFVRVLDFGIAKQHTEHDHALTSSGDMLGTPYTMSPEQVKSTRQADFRSDLWSLAVVAYRALTARWPFVGETPGQLFININEGRFPAPSELRPELGPEVDAWFLRALAHEPSARFDSARQLAETFSDALASVQGSPRLEPRVGPPARGEQRSAGAHGADGEQARGGDTLTPASSTAHPGAWRDRARRRVWLAAAGSGLAVGLGVLGWRVFSAPVAPTAKPVPAASTTASEAEPPATAERTPPPAPSSAPPRASAQPETAAITVVPTPTVTERQPRPPVRPTATGRPQRPPPRATGGGPASAPGPAPASTGGSKPNTAPVRNPGF